MNKNEFLEKLNANPRPVVIDFWAVWCGPCRAIEPALKVLESEYAGRVDLWKINADEHPDLLRELNVFGIPTLLAFRQARETGRRTGAASKEALAGLFESALSGEKPQAVGPAPLDRWLRLAAGAALIVIGLQNQSTLLTIGLASLGALVLFSAVYDRCPIYKAVSTRLSAWLTGQR